MELELIIVFITIAAALILFVSGLFPIDQTAILVMVTLMVSGVLSPEEAVSGFSNSATITILALLIISQGLKNTGAVDAIGDQILQITGTQWYITVLVIMLLSAVLSAFINTTAVVAVFIPIIFKVSKKSNLSVTALLMPLSFGAMVGGSSTMIGTSTNLLVNSVAQANGAAPFGIFDLTVFGVILLVTIILYMLLVGIRALKKKGKNIQVFDEEVESKNYLTELVVVPDSNLIDQKFQDLELYDRTEYELQKLIRSGKPMKPSKDLVIKEGDVITIKTDMHEIISINNNENVKITTIKNGSQKKSDPEENSDSADRLENRIIFEALVVPNSNLIGRRIKDVEFNRFYDASPLAARGGGLIKDEKLRNHKIQVGDILLMDGKNQMETEQSKHEWIVLQQVARSKIEKSIASRKKMLLAIAILLVVILLAVNNILPILVSAWLGVALMFLTKCISIKSAYENVEWKVIFLLAGIIPLGTALSKSGGDQYIANFLVTYTEGASLRVVVSVLFILTTLLTGIISNQATAVLLVPIAIQVGNSMGLPVEPLLIAILFGANTSFVTPVGYQTNAMIYGPGNYKFLDFVKIGGGLSLIFWILATWLIPILFN